MRKKPLLRQIYDFFTAHWILSALLLTGSGYWLALEKLVGASWGLCDTSGALTTRGHWCTWPVIGAFMVFALNKTHADQKNETAKYNGQFVLDQILQSLSAVKAKEMQRLCTYVKENYTKDNLRSFYEATQPREKIMSILENIQVALSNICGISRDAIGVSFSYTVKGSGIWTCIYSLNTVGDLSLGEVLAQPASTMRQLIDGQLHSVFFPDKKVAEDQHRYFRSARDDENHMVGSILCRDISIGESREFVQGVLSVSTYGTQLCRQKDKDTIHKIESILIDSYEIRLRTELALFYIRERLRPKCLSCPN